MVTFPVTLTTITRFSRSRHFWSRISQKRCILGTTGAFADNRRDAFSGQSRSTNIVPFHILSIVSYCAIGTLSFRRALFTIFDFKKCRDLEIGVIGHSMSLKLARFDRLCMVSY